MSLIGSCDARIGGEGERRGRQAAGAVSGVRAATLSVRDPQLLQQMRLYCSNVPVSIFSNIFL